MHFMKKKRRRRKGSHFSLSIVKEAMIWAGELVLVVVMAYLLVVLFGWRSNVVGNAMEPALYADDQILVNKFVYIVSHPKQDDVVLFLPNGNRKSHYYTRRVIAVPGDKVRIADGRIYVNGEEYETKYITDTVEDAGIAAEEITLGDGEYFVLGDNINSSEDSRYANIGNVSSENIIGKAWFRFASFRDFGFIK